MTTGSRKEPRYLFKREVIVEERLLTYLVDISREGLYLRTIEPLDVDTVVRLKIPSCHISVKAEVRHTRQGSGMGLRFIFENDKQRHEVHRIIDGLAESSGEVPPKPTVLVVEDSKDVREEVVTTLRDGGYSVTEAGDGVDAVKKLTSFHVDGIVLDLYMDKMDGLKLLNVIRETPAYIDTPVVVISGDATPGLVNRVFEAGADAFIPKSSSISSELIKIMDSLINKG